MMDDEDSQTMTGQVTEREIQFEKNRSSTEKHKKDCADCTQNNCFSGTATGNHAYLCACLTDLTCV